MKNNIKESLKINLNKPLTRKDKVEIMKIIEKNKKMRKIKKNIKIIQEMNTIQKYIRNKYYLKIYNK